MADVALECLVHEGVRAAIVANRTYERAAELAARHGAQALHYEQCWGRLAEVDLLLCSTAAPRPIVAREQVEPALRVRGDAPLCIVDIAVPRDVMVDVGTLHNVFLYDLDDLQAVVSTNLARRREELPAAEVIVATEVEQYWHWLAGLAAVPVLKLFRSQMEQVREAELAHAMRKLGHLAPDDQHAVEHFSRALMNKFLHDPSVRLRAASANGRGLAIVDALRYLFALDEADGPGDVPPAVAPEPEER
jgi:glutamyl-tRNA reductase